MKVILGVDAISPPLTGIGRYTYELATGLHQAKDVDARFFAMARWIEKPSDLLDPSRPSAVLRRNIAHVPFSGVLRKLYQSASRLRFAREVRKLQGFLYHSPNFYMVPFDGPTITTIHDLSVVHHPEFHTAERVDFMNREVPAALERSDHVIVVSNYVKHDLVKTFGFPTQRISVTHLGVDPAYRPRPAHHLLTVLAAYGLVPGSYILCVSTIEPRKNIARLIEAYSALPDRLQRAYPLVLIGDKGWKSEGTHRDLQHLESSGCARYLGYVPEQELPLFYSGASVFAYPSLFEGFGLPVLEAMASGVPVITSNRTSLPEVAGGAACLVDPLDVRQLSERLRELLEDETLRADLSASGLERAGQFTWPAFSNATIDVYRRVSSKFHLASPD